MYLDFIQTEMYPRISLTYVLIQYAHNQTLVRYGSVSSAVTLNESVLYVMYNVKIIALTYGLYHIY